MGVITPDVSQSIEQQSSKAENKYDSESEDSDRPKPKKYQSDAASSKLPKPETINLTTAAIARYWLTRMRFISVLKIQKESYGELNVEPECRYCKADFNLNSELIQNIEDMFRDFLLTSGEPMPGYSYQRWNRYFKAHARYRTLCFDCSAMIQEYHKKRMKLMRLRSHPETLDPLGWQYREHRLRARSVAATPGHSRLRRQGTVATNFSRAEAALPMHEPEESVSQAQPVERPMASDLADLRAHLVRRAFAPGTRLRMIVDKWVGMVRRH